MSAPGSHHWSQKLRIQRRQWRSVSEPSNGWSGIECILTTKITEVNLPYCEPNWEYFLWESEANDLKSLYHYIIRDSCFSTFQIVIKSCICMISFCGVVALRQRLHFWNVNVRYNVIYRVFDGNLQKRKWKIDTSLGRGYRSSKPFFLTLQTGRKFPLGTEENKICIFDSSGNM